MHNTKSPEVDCTWPVYLMQNSPFLAHLVFANEKAWL